MDDDFYDDDYDDSDEMDGRDDECGLDDDGQCSLAGTEHCDFECPWRDSDGFAGSAAWRKKHGEDAVDEVPSVSGYSDRRREP